MPSGKTFGCAVQFFTWAPEFGGSIGFSLNALVLSKKMDTVPFQTKTNTPLLVLSEKNGVCTDAVPFQPKPNTLFSDSANLGPPPGPALCRAPNAGAQR